MCVDDGDVCRGSLRARYEAKYENGDCVFMPKFDGWRAVIHGGVAKSKTGKDITKYFDGVPHTTEALDCEVVAVREMYDDAIFGELPVRTGHNAVHHYADTSLTKLVFYVFDVHDSAEHFAARRAKVEAACAESDQLVVAPCVDGYAGIFGALIANCPDLNDMSTPPVLEGVVIRQKNKGSRRPRPVAFKVAWITKPTVVVSLLWLGRVGDFLFIVWPFVLQARCLGLLRSIDGFKGYVSYYFGNDDIRFYISDGSMNVSARNISRHCQFYGPPLPVELIGKVTLYTTSPRLFNIEHEGILRDKGGEPYLSNPLLRIT